MKTCMFCQNRAPDTALHCPNCGAALPIENSYQNTTASIHSEIYSEADDNHDHQEDKITQSEIFEKEQDISSPARIHPRIRFIHIGAAVLVFVLLISVIFFCCSSSNHLTMNHIASIAEQITEQYENALTESSLSVYSDTVLVSSETIKAGRATSIKTNFSLEVVDTTKQDDSFLLATLHAIDLDGNQTVDVLTFSCTRDPLPSSLSEEIPYRITTGFIRRFSSFDADAIWTPEESEPNWGYTEPKASISSSERLGEFVLASNESARFTLNEQFKFAVSSQTILTMTMYLNPQALAYFPNSMALY